MFELQKFNSEMLIKIAHYLRLNNMLLSLILLILIIHYIIYIEKLYKKKKKEKKI